MDENEKGIVLVMFDCPFYTRMEPSLLKSEEKAQDFLNDWRSREGDAWLESVGPVVKKRELRNIERYFASAGRLQR